MGTLVIESEATTTAMLAVLEKHGEPDGAIH